ncbi:hypothetical protein DFJ58DRAFT_718601 [Suillus subalutaceus]|uniref:uncharacterized protein n=1 Tax=Suillus subalutaceus TaxID=48586 RepID=UPI001B86F385|nr:uncharacterized protein DFJ58DRAFT_718601 [Suillus subalutaceus]KAG1839101.1 hypothetical protein DFJ58DRAFT_718601 [Suillus subalutaceus]
MQTNDVDFCDRLLAFLDDTISNVIPDDPDPNISVSSVFASSVLRVWRGSEHEFGSSERFASFSEGLSVHKHNLTCFKYWKGPPSPRECRFDLDESHFYSAKICLRCLDGMVNIVTHQCWKASTVQYGYQVHRFMGASAKVDLYYITDYIRSPQLKAHVAYAALDFGKHDDLTIRAKELIRKMAAYLMEFGNHYTSHEFINVFWTLFENHVDAILPLPKSYVAEEHCETHIPDDNETHSLNETDYDQADSLKPPSDEEVMQNLADNDLANDEVGLSMDDSGNLVPRANQVQDYTLRSSGLRDICSGRGKQGHIRSSEVD